MKKIVHLILALIILEHVAAQDVRYFRLSGPVPSRIQELTPDGFLVWTNEITTAVFAIQHAVVTAGEIDWKDFAAVPVTNTTKTVHRIFDPNPPSGMAFILAGSFTMGNALSGGFFDELPAHPIEVSAFYLDRCEVSRELWERVYQWAVNHSYTFDNAGFGKAANYPVLMISWYDAVKWCNARSESEGKTPAYYTDADRKTVYRTGQVHVRNDWVRWDQGYRLPTEAEWEKAARGGLNGKRFPWGDSITHNQANYYSKAIYNYDISNTRGFHPGYTSGGHSYTSPVGSFSANAYGLCDMSGNAWEWCWDWYGDYSSEGQIDPHGPMSGSYRILRGGGWNHEATWCRAAARNGQGPGAADFNVGFRTVLPANP